MLTLEWEAKEGALMRYERVIRGSCAQNWSPPKVLCIPRVYSSLTPINAFPAVHNHIRRYGEPKPITDSHLLLTSASVSDAVVHLAAPSLLRRPSELVLQFLHIILQKSTCI